jgi:predicted ATPase
MPEKSWNRTRTEVEPCASELMELATRHHFAHWRAVGAIYGGWARSASGDTAGGLAWIEDGLQHWRATGEVRVTPVWLTLKAEALHFAGHTCEALEAIKNAEALIGRTHEREWFAELHRLRGVFLATIGAEEAQIEASFGEAIRTAKQQKSISLTKRAEESYAEYRRQKRERLGHGLPPEPGKHCFWF